MTIKSRLAALRGLMRKHRIDAYLIPSADEHQNEYVPKCFRRREWISGFTGSAGDVLVTARSAALWTDGRYFLQAHQQLSGSGILLMKQGVAGTPTMPQWLNKTIKAGRVGVDPRTLSISNFQKLASDFAEIGISLVSVAENLIDVIWKDRPLPPADKVRIHPLKYSGETLQSKLARVREAMREYGARAHVISALDAIAWLFNIRGTDVDHVPVVISYAIITDREALLFLDPKKMTDEVVKHLGRSTQVFPYGTFGATLSRVARSAGKVWVDPNTGSQWIAEIVSRFGKLLSKESPIMLMKATKNAAELRGIRNAHVRDGVAMVRGLMWLDQSVASGKVTEISLAEKLRDFRARSKLFTDTSFDTIVGYADHGAIIHYSATPATDVRLRRSNLIVIDSGGQYLDGTTDITRTVSLGKPTAVQKEQFTRVLKGHIQLSLAKFPHGTSGKQLDTLARKALWDVGLNYGHGTGHGVGAFLSVHEGPHSISPTRDTGVPLVPGMICSNEPGYYADGEYGMRVENLVCVVKDQKLSSKSLPFYGFETLTLCPIDLQLVDKKLLTPEEKSWLNAYHARVRSVLSRFLAKEEAAWLAKATQPL